MYYLFLILALVVVIFLFFNRLLPRWLSAILILLFVVLAIYIFISQIILKSITNRVPDCLLVFNNPAYNVQFQMFPQSYFNESFQKQMDYMVADYYWMSSRKSYLACGESYDFPSLDAIGLVLSKGARVVHLDIYPVQTSLLDPTATAVVRSQHLNPMATALPFEDCLRTIRGKAWEKQSMYPLILLLDIHGTNDDGQNGETLNKYYLAMIGSTLMNVLGDRFVDKLYSFNGRNGQYPLGSAPIKAMLGKVAIVTNIYPTNVGALDECIHGVSNDKQQLINRLIYEKSNLDYGGLASTYPDTNALIQHNYKNLTVVEPQNTANIFNFWEPKEDIYNIDPRDAWRYGCQIVLMNFQLWDQGLQETVAMFQTSSLVLKPDNLRFIPTAPKPVVPQNPDLYYDPRTVSQMYNGHYWFKFDI